MSFAVGGRGCCPTRNSVAPLDLADLQRHVAESAGRSCETMRGIAASRMLAVLRSVAESAALVLGPRCWLKFRVVDDPPWHSARTTQTEFLHSFPQVLVIDMEDNLKAITRCRQDI